MMPQSVLWEQNEMKCNPRSSQAAELFGHLLPFHSNSSFLGGKELWAQFIHSLIHLLKTSSLRGPIHAMPWDYNYKQNEGATLILTAEERQWTSEYTKCQTGTSAIKKIYKVWCGKRRAVLHGMVREAISAKVDISQTSEKVTRSVVWLFGGGGNIPERGQWCKGPGTVVRSGFVHKKEHPYPSGRTMKGSETKALRLTFKNG